MKFAFYIFMFSLLSGLLMAQDQAKEIKPATRSEIQIINNTEVEIVYDENSKIIEVKYLGINIKNYLGQDFAVEFFDYIIDEKFDLNKYEYKPEQSYTTHIVLNPHIYNQNEKFSGLYQRFMSRMYLEQLNYGFSYLSKKNSNTTEASLELKKIIESQLKHFKSSVLKQHFLHNYLREQNFFDFDDQRFLELLTILKSYGFEPESKNVLLSAPCQWINKLSKLVSHCIEQSHSQNSKYTEANLIKSIGNKINIFEQVFGLNLLNLNCQTVNYHYGELTIATKIQNSEIFTKIETNHPMINIDSNQFYTDNSIYSFNFKQALLNDISISKEELKNGIENTTKDDTDIEKSCLEIDYERIINELSMPKTKPSDSLKIVSTDALDSFKIISYKSNHIYINFEVRITDQNSCTNKDAIKAKLMLFLNSNSRAIDAYYKNSQIENFRPDIMDACGPGTRASVQIQGQFKNLNQFFKN